VNLRKDVLDELTVGQNGQPLITKDEALRAVEIALADAEVGPLFRERYEQKTGTPLVSADQLQVTAGVYRASNMPSRTTATDCGLHRCAQLLLEVGIPIVDLSTEQVVHPGP